jgi:hypothetical protein
MRYDADNVERALNHWSNVPPTGNVLSKLTNKNHDQSTIFLLKSQPVDGFNMLNHHYLEFDGLAWHPGAPNYPIFVESEAGDDSTTRAIYETCNTCARKFMSINFDNDRQFNLIVNNCQTQLGHSSQTSFTLLFLLSLITLIFLKSWILIILNLTAFVALFFSKEKNKILFDKCKHII